MDSFNLILFRTYLLLLLHDSNYKAPWNPILKTIHRLLDEASPATPPLGVTATIALYDRTYN